MITMFQGRRLLLVLGVVIIALPAIYIYDYTQNNPKFCTTCHLMNEAYETWEASAMHDLNCHTCHETDMVTSISHVVEVLTKNPQEVTKTVEIDNELCENCHASEDPQWLNVVNTAGHKVHFFGEENHADCIDCHGLELHVFRPPEESCLECHDPESVHASDTMHVDCMNCHQFLVEGRSLEPAREDCLECHSGMEEAVFSVVVQAHENSTCTQCHNPHGEVTQVECSLCHQAEEGLHNVSAHTDCQSCHLPHQEKPVREVCGSCHLDKEDHFPETSCTSCHR